MAQFPENLSDICLSLSEIFDYFQVFKWTILVPLKYISPDENFMCYAYLSHILF